MGISNNLLLYGPPGTGKTYNSVNYAVAIIEGRTFEDVVLDPYILNLEKYDRYTKMGRITFMTFHQSLGYDDFIEGVKPVVNDDGTLVYLPMPGVFYDFCRKAEFPRSRFGIMPNGYDNIRQNADIWIVIPGGEYGPNSERSRMVNEGKIDRKYVPADVRVGDVLISLIIQDASDAFYVIESIEDDTVDVVPLRVFEEPQTTRILRISEAEVRQAPVKVPYVTINEVIALTETEEEGKHDTGECVFIIDEINRGNISRIFGEMITLLESSRRKGMDECLEVWLPQMKRKFSIPQNVYVLGTMNTADKSLAGLDTALRRRFEFIEKMPDPSVLMKREVSDVNLGKLLTVINKRIELLYDREHTMGHAYFISVKTMPQLAECFKKKVIPLLQEYFFDDYEKMAWVMGKASNPRECPFITIRKKSEFQMMFDLPDVFDIVSDDSVFLNPENYIQIYAGVED